MVQRTCLLVSRHIIEARGKGAAADLGLPMTAWKDPLPDIQGPPVQLLRLPMPSLRVKV
jgi:hypothetical protein